MKLETILTHTAVLHVKVPDTIDPSEFEADIGICVPDWQDTPPLKDGIPVCRESVRMQIEDTEPNKWHKGVLEFLQACVNHPTPSDEFFFHI